MMENDYAIMDIVAYRYVPVGSDLVQKPLKLSSIRLYHNVISNCFVAKCQCGLNSVFGEADYRMGQTMNGGHYPLKGSVGVDFGTAHRWIRLHCGQCSEVQWYFREDELGIHP